VTNQPKQQRVRFILDTTLKGDPFLAPLFWLFCDSVTVSWKHQKSREFALAPFHELNSGPALTL